MDKKVLRAYALNQRRCLTAVEKSDKSEIICSKVYELIKNKQCIGMYASLKEEVDTILLIDKLLSDGKKVLLPKTLEVGLSFHEISSMNDLQEGKFHVLEPVTDEVSIHTAEVLLVPLVAFDKHKHRIGFGKGYYDHALSGYTGMKIGLAFECQCVEDITVEDHDIALDLIVTESGVY